jgi:sortase A
MKLFNDQVLRWLAIISFLLALFFLTWAFYIPAKSVIAESLVQSAWTKTLAGEIKVRPWPWSGSWPVARIKIPQLGIDEILLSSDHEVSIGSLSVRQVRTFYDKSSGITLLSATQDSQFYFLQDLELGHHIFLQDETGQVQHYQVEDIQIMDSRNLGISTPLDENWLTLACNYPFDSISGDGPLRYVVSAEAINPVNQSVVPIGA